MGYNRSTKSVARRLTSSKRLKLSVRSLQGVLQNNQEIAVKKLSLGSQQGVCEFLNEVLLLLKVQQRNLVSLLGCCASFGHKMLVYPYFPNGSLDHILFGICILPSLVATTVDFTMKQQWPIRGSAEQLLSLATSDLFLSSSHQVDTVLSKFKAVAMPSMQLCSNGFSRHKNCLSG